MNRAYYKQYSPSLGRDMEMLVFGDRGARVVVFPTRGGRFYDYENFGLAQSAAFKVEAGYLQLFCVDSIDLESLYAEDIPPPERLNRHLQFERYILEEVLPFSCYVNQNPFVIAHGCSLGAFHAVNIAFRHPERFGKVVALSGRYDLTVEMGPYRDLFDGWQDERLYDNTPTQFLPALTDESRLSYLRRMEIILAIGQEDAFYANNIALSDTLRLKGVDHDLHVWEGEAHRPRFWRQMIDLYL